MKIPLWSRLVFFKVLKLLSLYLLGFFTLYSFIDYSTRMHDFSKNPSLSLLNIGFYYSQVFIKRLDIILPLAFMIATLKLLLDMNKKRESIALFTSGLKKSTFLKPLILCALLVSSLLYVSFEYLTPKSLTFIESFEKKYFRQETLSKGLTQPQFLKLSNGGLIIYSSYNSTTNRFDDVFFLPSKNELWKFSSLSLTNLDAAEGEHFILDNQGQFQLIEHLPKIELPNLSVIYDSAQLNSLTIECGSFSFLKESLKKIEDLDPSLSAKITAQIFYKITVLFLPFLITMICACFGLVFSRKLPIFMIYAMTIFGMIGYFLMMDAAIILGESQILPSYVALLSPLLLMFLFFLPRFIKCCKN